MWRTKGKNALEITKVVSETRGKGSKDKNTHQRSFVLNLMQIRYANQPMVVLDSSLNKRSKRCYSNVLFEFVNDLIFLSSLFSYRWTHLLVGFFSKSRVSCLCIIHETWNAPSVEEMEICQTFRDQKCFT